MESSDSNQSLDKKKRYKTGFNLFMQENSRNATNLPQTGQSTLGTNATLVAAAWRMIDSQVKEDWNKLAQNQREDIDCGLLSESKPTCEKCQKVFSRLADKRYHQENCGEHVCPSCGTKFSDGIKLRLHENIHKEKYKCQSCQKCFGTKQALVRHEAIHKTEKSHQCNKCNQMFTIKTNLTRHMKKKHPWV